MYVIIGTDKTGVKFVSTFEGNVQMYKTLDGAMLQCSILATSSPCDVFHPKSLFDETS